MPSPNKDTLEADKADVKGPGARGGIATRCWLTAIPPEMLVSIACTAARIGGASAIANMEATCQTLRDIILESPILWQSMCERIPRLVKFLDAAKPLTEPNYRLLYKDQMEAEAGVAKMDKLDADPPPAQDQLSEYVFTIELLYDLEVRASWSGPMELGSVDQAGLPEGVDDPVPFLVQSEGALWTGPPEWFHDWHAAAFNMSFTGEYADGLEDDLKEQAYENYPPFLDRAPGAEFAAAWLTPEGKRINSALTAQAKKVEKKLSMRIFVSRQLQTLQLYHQTAQPTLPSLPGNVIEFSQIGVACGLPGVQPDLQSDLIFPAMDPERGVFDPKHLDHTIPCPCNLRIWIYAENPMNTREHGLYNDEEATVLQWLQYGLPWPTREG